MTALCYNLLRFFGCRKGFNPEFWIWFINVVCYENYGEDLGHWCVRVNLAIYYSSLIGWNTGAKTRKGRKAETDTTLYRTHHVQHIFRLTLLGRIV